MTLPDFSSISSSLCSFLHRGFVSKIEFPTAAMDIDDRFSSQCTLLVSQCKSGNQEFESEYLHCPLFSIKLFQRKYWFRIQVQLHYLYIFVGRVDRMHPLCIHKTAHIIMLSLYFSPSDLQSFGDELNRSSNTAPANI